jgi:hypothetical protein
MDLIDRTHGLDLLYSLLAFLCEEELQDHPAIAAPVMAAFNIVAEHHVPDALLAQGSGLDARDVLHRADVLAHALALSATGVDEHLRLLRIVDLLRTAQADLPETLAEEP